jgi:PAS domain S-box-containing protein
VRRAAAGIVAIVAIAGLLTFLERFVGLRLGLWEIPFPPAGTAGPYPVGRMSFLTGGLFFMSCAAIELRLLKNPSHHHNLIAALGMFPLLVGLASSLGYLYGTPILYGGSAIPLAPMTALGFMVLGSGLLILAGPEARVLRRFVGALPEARLLRVFVPLIVLTILLNGLLQEKLFLVLPIDHVYISALTSVMVAAITGLLIVNLARSVFRRATEAEIERQRTSEALQKFRLGIERSVDAVFITDPMGTITFVNPAFGRIYGFSNSEAIGQTPRLLKSGLMPQEFYRSMWNTLLAGNVATVEITNKTRDGRLITIEASVNPILDDAGKLVGFLAIQRDITDRKKAKEALQQLVNQKELFLQELQHRVKNNLNIIASLLNLETPNIPDEQSRQVFADAQGRIRSIAKIYERLSDANDPGRVDLGKYIQDLARSLFHTLNMDGARIRLLTTLADVQLDTRRAVPLGLILNELMTNVQKYAFPGASVGEVRIDLARSGEEITLSVADSGVGLPPEFVHVGGTSMGLKLVGMLTEQIDGTLSIEGTGGTTVRVRFSL